MLSKKTSVPFRGTEAQEQALLEVIREMKDEKGALMPILQKAQDISFHHLENQRKAIIRTIRAENEAKEAEKKE